MKEACIATANAVVRKFLLASGLKIRVTSDGLLRLNIKRSPSFASAAGLVHYCHGQLVRPRTEER
jgi:hypothetical protein